LVPIGDEILFNEYESCLNLGGIANISFKKNKNRIAFDICAVNIVINFLAEKLGLAMDEDGNIAGKGRVNEKLFKQLNNDPFYSLKDKKSIGREWVEEKVLSVLDCARTDNGKSRTDNRKLKTEDLIATFTEHAAFQIASVIKKNQLKNVLVTGGGAYNRFLVKRIFELSNAEIILPAKEIINFKEAIIFALLGVLRMNGEVNALKNVTGAKEDSCGGSVYFSLK
ncbi:MAG: anhydro-N-acetylmuramic acid kinase, partial [Bacteroidia bacterium]|nr:anhydro-N-acetylmuramic acid kinase [Bacteroidia bacterium]